MQPPSGGCVLKLVGFQQNGSRISQPPSGGCVLKLFKFGCQISAAEQPPSGGCVLKPPATTTFRCRINAAAFGRLCVETSFGFDGVDDFKQPPSGGCVLKLSQ